MYRGYTKGVSESSGSAAQTAFSFFSHSVQSISFGGTGGGLDACRLTTTTCSTVGLCFSASSTIGFRLMILLRSNPTSAVMTSLDSASLMRLAKAGALKPEYTTL
jgi:hypothetical protein